MAGRGVERVGLNGGGRSRVAAAVGAVQRGAVTMYVYRRRDHRHADHVDEEASALAAAAALISSLMAFQLSKLLSICVGVGKRTTSQSIHTVEFATQSRVVSHLCGEVGRRGEDGREVFPHGRDEIRRESHLHTTRGTEGDTHGRCQQKKKLPPKKTTTRTSFLQSASSSAVKMAVTGYPMAFSLST